MAVELTSLAKEEGSYTIKATFTDEEDAALTPNSIKWSLKTRDGKIVNARSSVSVAAPASTEYFTLSGDDLAYLSDYDDGRRIFRLYGTYTSSYGTSLPFAENIHFDIENLV
jgi:hypothetical protein